MQQLSVDYAAVLAALHPPLDTDSIGAALLTALGDRYDARQHSGSALHELQQSGATYLFDLASSAHLPQEDRTVAAWALTPTVVLKRDTAYQRGFPMTPGDSPVDRGHVIPHLSGGEFGPNIFRQDRALNRGWSEQGKRYRALERKAAATPGTLYVAHLIYVDNSAYPSEVETGLLRGKDLHVERFDNRPTSGLGRFRSTGAERRSPPMKGSADGAEEQRPRVPLGSVRTASVETLGTACDVEPGRVEAMLGSDYARRVSDAPVVLEITAAGERHADMLEDRETSSGGHGRYPNP